MDTVIINNLIAQFDEVHNGIPWLDESFSKKFKLINEENAFIRPRKDIHSIAEILSHLVVWRTEILSRLNGNPRQLSADSPENWKSNDELENEGWESLLDEFDQNQNELKLLLQSKEDDFLATSYHDRNYKYLVEGLLHHDLYHLGQIGLVNKMLTSKNSN
jgi:uncharacterized damage-inducible protein DinB